MYTKLSNTLLNPWMFVAILLLLGVALVCKKLFALFRIKDVEHEILDRNNVGVATSFSAFLFGSYIVVGSSLLNPVLEVSSGNWVSWVFEFAYILLTLIVVRIFTAGFDWIFLRKIDFGEELVVCKNTAAGILEGFFFLSSATVIAGANFGPSNGFLADIVLVLVYSALAMLVIWIAFKVFERMFADCVQEEIRRGNSAMALATGGFIFSIAVVMGYVISGPVIGSLAEDLVYTFLYALAGIAVCLTALAVLDVLVLSKNSFRNELKEPNVGIGVFLMFASLVASVFFIYVTNFLL